MLNAEFGRFRFWLDYNWFWDWFRDRLRNRLNNLWLWLGFFNNFSLLGEFVLRIILNLNAKVVSAHKLRKFFIFLFGFKSHNISSFGMEFMP